MRAILAALICLIPNVPLADTVVAKTVIRARSLIGADHVMARYRYTGEVHSFDAATGQVERVQVYISQMMQEKIGKRLRRMMVCQKEI